MNLDPPVLRPTRNEPQLVAAKIAEWRKFPPVAINGVEYPIDTLIAKAAEKCEEAKLHGSRAANCLAWMDSVIDGSRRGGVWPGEFRESSAAPLKPAPVVAKPHIFVPKELRK